MLVFHGAKLYIFAGARVICVRITKSLGDTAKSFLLSVGMGGR
jgi:hypothetical protein